MWRASGLGPRSAVRVIFQLLSLLFCNHEIITTVIITIIITITIMITITITIYNNDNNNDNNTNETRPTTTNNVNININTVPGRDKPGSVQPLLETFLEREIHFFLSLS